MNTNNYRVKTALISVSDKSGIVEFGKSLNSLGIKIYSTGGTYKLLSQSDVEVYSVSDITNFPEILDGRVKTLHPAIHAGLLADLGKEEHIEQLNKLNINSIDLLVVNLYPFEDTLKKDGVSHEELIENIDIGGPTMLRSAAKNYKWTLPIINPNRYDEVIDLLSKNNGIIPLDYRAKLAGEVFRFTSYYDSLITNYLNGYNNTENTEKYTLALSKEFDLRYGENPHQKATLYGNFTQLFDKIHGKELSYNNIIDLNAASQIILEFDEPTVAIIKHTNPCGVAKSEDLCTAWDKAFATDTVSPFGGIVAVNREVDAEFANKVHSIFLEVIIAPSFSPEALEVLTKKRDRRLIQVDFDKLRSSFKYDYRSVAGGFLKQAADIELFGEDNLKVVTEKQPSEKELEAMMFAWKVCKHVKSNAIVYTSNDRTLAIGAGQMSRVDSSRIAVEKAKLMGLDLKNSVVASDAFFPFADGILQAIEAGASAVIQPGGSVRDDEVIEAANKNNITMIFTGMRHFRH